MTYSVILSDGMTDHELIYDPASQTDFKLYYGMRVQAGEPVPLWHRPDDANPQLIRLKNEPQTMFLTMSVKGASWDDVVNALTPIKRLVDGDDQQAARYHTVGDVNKVYVRVQPTGATNYTDFTVIYGHVDDSGSYYKTVDVANTSATQVVVTLIVEPLGQGAPITLRNDLPSSPHCLEDSNSDGLPDGWTEVNNPTTSIYTPSYVVGGQCMRVDTSASGQGVYIRTTITASADLAAYVWVSVISSNQVNVSLRSNNGANVIDFGTLTSTDSNGIADKSMMVGTLTWYRVPLSGTASAHTNAEIRLTTSSSGAQVFFVDAAYLQEGTLTIPDAFASASDIQNRYDPVTANPERINYLDVWGVPGDSDALVDQDLDITAVTGTKNGYIIGKITDGTIPVTSGIHWVDTGSISFAITSGSATAPSDANRSGGAYDRYTADGTTPANAILEITIGSTFADFVNTMATDRRVFAIARSSSTATTISLTQSALLFFNVDSTPVSVTATNTWELLDLGMLKKVSPLVTGYHSTTALIVDGLVSPTVASSTFDIDAILLVPATDDGFAIVGEYINGFGLSTSNNLYVLGSKSSVVFSQGRTDDSYRGTIWTCPAGNKMTRYIYTMIDMSGTQTHHLTDTTTVTLTVTPRTRHLLGTS